ncbi:MAG: hypothetical protein SNJ75_15980 [Gemmataceae bacterium]
MFEIWPRIESRASFTLYWRACQDCGVPHGDEDRQVELLDTEPGKVTAIEEADQLAGDGSEGSAVGNILVRDTVVLGRCLGDGDGRVDAPDDRNRLLIRANPEEADLNDAVGLRIDAGGFDVHERQGSLEAKKP